MRERSNVITVSVTTLRANLKKYLSLAKERQVFVHLGNDEAIELVPSRPLTDLEIYVTNKSQQKHLEVAMQEEKEGKGKKITATELRKRAGL